MQINKTYDNMISTALINMFSIGKKEKTLVIYNFNINDRGHLALINIALMARELFDFKLELEAPFFQFLKLRRQFKFKKAIKRNEILDRGNLNCVYFISDIEKAYNEYGTFRKIYEEYYKR